VSVSIAIPYRGDPGGERERLLTFVVDRLKRIVPQADISIADGNPAELFNRSAARNRAVARTTGAVVVVHDADIVLDETALKRALARASRSPSVVWPYSRFTQLTREESDMVLAAGAVSPGRDRAVKAGLPMWGPRVCGGAWVMQRGVWDRLGGFDERFTHWGGEDTAFSIWASAKVGLVAEAGPAYGLHHESERHPMTDLEKRYRAAVGTLGDLETLAAGRRPDTLLLD